MDDSNCGMANGLEFGCILCQTNSWHNLLAIQIQNDQHIFSASEFVYYILFWWMVNIGCISRKRVTTESRSITMKMIICSIFRNVVLNSWLICRKPSAFKLIYICIGPYIYCSCRSPAYIICLCVCVCVLWNDDHIKCYATSSILQHNVNDEMMLSHR